MATVDHAATHIVSDAPPADRADAMERADGFEEMKGDEEMIPPEENAFADDGDAVGEPAKVALEVKRFHAR